MLVRTYDTEQCSIARSLEIVGERWTMLILRDTFQGLHRFEEFLSSLGVTRNVLSSRLCLLVHEGVLERRQYQTRPDRFEYHLTPKGRELWPVLMHLLAWGDRHYAGPEGGPRIVEHTGCGGRLNAELHCDRCGERLRPGIVTVRDRA